MTPYEIILQTATVYLGPVGETFPEIQATPAGNWVKLGTNDIRNYADGGVKIAYSQTLKEHRNAGSTGPIKVTRTEESLKISLVLEDLSTETFAKIMNAQTLVDTAADADTGGYRSITLRSGETVATVAMLIRTVSPYGDSWNAQYAIPKVFQSGNPEPVYRKDEAASLAVEFTALEDPNASTAAERFGHYRAQDAAATG